MTQKQRGSRSSRRNKTMAVLAGGAIVGIGVSATLAAWTDSEWIFGGNGAGTGPGIGTSLFEVEQNVSSPFDASAFVQNETNPGESATFGVDALSLAPGDTVYAPVALRTVDGSVGGDLALQAAVPAVGIAANDAGDLLWNALDLRVATSASAFAACNASAFAAGSTIVVDGALSAAAGTAGQTLLADSGSTQFYCFEISLPSAPTLPAGAEIDDLQGRSVAPAWEFASESF